MNPAHICTEAEGQSRCCSAAASATSTGAALVRQSPRAPTRLALRFQLGNLPCFQQNVDNPDDECKSIG